MAVNLHKHQTTSHSDRLILWYSHTTIRGLLEFHGCQPTHFIPNHQPQQEHNTPTLNNQGPTRVSLPSEHTHQTISHSNYSVTQWHQQTDQGPASSAFHGAVQLANTKLSKQYTKYWTEDSYWKHVSHTASGTVTEGVMIFSTWFILFCIEYLVTIHSLHETTGSANTKNQSPPIVSSSHLLIRVQDS